MRIAGASSGRALLDQAIDTLRQPAWVYPLLAQAALLVHLRSTELGPVGSTALADWHRPLLEAVDAALAIPPRAAGDQSLRDIEWVCHCTQCKLVIQWAESATGLPFRVALNETDRQHIGMRLKAAAAPIRTETLKQGRPYSLVCHNQGDALARETQHRHALTLVRVRLRALTSAGAAVAPALHQDSPP